jgi:hypothetical protein
MRIRGLGMAGLGLVVASILAAANARAAVDLDLVFHYSTGGVAPQPIGTQGDTIGLRPYSGAVELTGYGHHDSVGGELNSVTWTRVPGATRSGTLTLTEDITVTLGQTVQDATLSYTFVTSHRGQSMVEAGSPVTLQFGSYLLTITPQDSTWYGTDRKNDLRRHWREFNKRDRDSTWCGTGMGDPRNRLNANFTLTAVPEPTTVVAGAGALGLVVLAVFRSKRSGAIKIGA